MTERKGQWLTACAERARQRLEAIPLASLGPAARTLLGIKHVPCPTCDGRGVVLHDPRTEIDETSTRSWKNRILWNRRPSDKDAGDIDEIVIDHPTSIHIEQMDDRHWWIGIYLSEEGEEVLSWTGGFSADSRGRMTFYEVECDLEWDRDETHEEKVARPNE